MTINVQTVRAPDAKPVRCAKCGHRNAATEDRCAKCNGSLCVVCPQCGHSNQRNRSRCTECRARLHRRFWRLRYLYRMLPLPRWFTPLHAVGLVFLALVLYRILGYVANFTYTPPVE